MCDDGGSGSGSAAAPLGPLGVPRLRRLEEALERLLLPEALGFVLLLAMASDESGERRGG